MARNPRYPRVSGSPAAKAQGRAAFAASGGFAAVAGAALSATVDSNTITLANIGTGVALTITGGSYSKNGAAFATAPTTVSDGDTLRLRVTSSASNGATTTVTATIGGSPRSFSVTTAAAPGAALSISGTLTSATVGGADAFAPVIAGGTPSYTLSLLSGTLPPGRAIGTGADNLKVVGTYTTAGSYSYTLRVTDSVGAMADLAVGPVVVVSGASALAITGTPGAATQGTPYTFTPGVTGGSGTKTFSYTGTLPGGLSFSTSTGAISGTPSATGTFSGISITVSDTSGSATLSGLSVTVAAAAVAAITPPNWDFVMGLDSRTADALVGSLGSGGYLASTLMYGPAAYLQQETGGRMRLAPKPNFGIGNSISTYSAAIPRKNALGTVVDSTPKTWARGTDSANKGADYVAGTGAGIFVMLHGGADQPSDMASGLSFANLRTYLNNMPAGVLKIVFSEQPFGVNSKGQTLGSSAQVFKDLSDQIKTLSFDSGHPNARSDVIVVDTWARIFDPANSTPGSGIYRNKRGYYRDDRHYTPWGARDIAALVHQRLVSVYGSAYTGMASRASLPVTNGASIAADTIGVHPGFVHTNPCFTIAGNGQLTANQFWLTGPTAADIPTGWQFGASTTNGAALGGAITVAVDRARTGADGYPEPQITFGGTLRGFTGVASQSGTTLTVESGTGTIVVGMVIQINGGAVTVVTALGTGTGGPGTYTVNTTATLASQAFLGGTSITYALFQLAQAAGQLTVSDKLRAVGRVSVAAGSVGLQSSHLRLLVQDATISKTQSALEMVGSIGGAGARDGNLMNNDGFDAANPAGDIIVSRLLDLQDPDMSTANGGPGVAASISSCAISLDIALTNYTGADLPISAVVRVSRLGAWRVS